MVEFSQEQIVEILNDLKHNLRFKAMTTNLQIRNYLKMFDESIFSKTKNVLVISIPTRVFYELKMYENTTWLYDLMEQYNKYSYVLKIHNRPETIEILEKGFQKFESWSKMLDVQLNISMYFEYNSIHNRVHELQLILTASETGAYSFNMKSLADETQDPLVEIYNDYKIIRENFNLIAEELYKKHILTHV